MLSYTSITVNILNPFEGFAGKERVEINIIQTAQWTHASHHHSQMNQSHRLKSRGEKIKRALSSSSERENRGIRRALTHVSSPEVALAHFLAPRAHFNSCLIFIFKPLRAFNPPHHIFTYIGNLSFSPIWNTAVGACNHFFSIGRAPWRALSLYFFCLWNHWKSVIKYYCWKRSHFSFTGYNS